MEFSLLAAALLGVAMALAVLRLERVRGVTDRRDLVDLVIGAAVVGLAVGRVAARHQPTDAPTGSVLHTWRSRYGIRITRLPRLPLVDDPTRFLANTRHGRPRRAVRSRRVARRVHVQEFLRRHGVHIAVGAP